MFFINRNNINFGGRTKMTKRDYFFRNKSHDKQNVTRINLSAILYKVNRKTSMRWGIQQEEGQASRKANIKFMS